MRKDLAFYLSISPRLMNKIRYLTYIAAVRLGVSLLVGRYGILETSTRENQVPGTEVAPLVFFFFFLERSGHRAGQAGPMQRAAMYVCVRRNATQLESEREKEERK